MVKVELLGSINLQEHRKGEMLTYAGAKGDELDLPDNMAKWVFDHGLGFVAEHAPQPPVAPQQPAAVAATAKADDVDKSDGEAPQPGTKPDTPPPRMRLKRDQRNGHRKGR